MTNLTLLELAAIAVALDEEGAERKRRWAVNSAWSNREIEGEFVTLYKELIDDIFFHKVICNCFPSTWDDSCRK
jgi:hypothetical protein